MIAKKLDNLFAEALADKVFPGAMAGILLERNERQEKYIIGGGFTDETKKFNVNRYTFFDLASLTKPFVTTLSIVVLIRDGKISFQSQLKDIFSKKIAEDKKFLTIGQLLQHSAGFQATSNYYDLLKDVKNIQERKEKLFRLLMDERIAVNEENTSLYSDLGFLLLGCVIEEITGESLEDFWVKNIARPLHLADSLLFLPKAKGIGVERIACTERCIFTGQMLCGDVHDENCRILGGVTGHAGLFGTVEGVLNLCGHLLKGWKGGVNHQLIPGELLRLIFRRNTAESRWCLGFDTPSEFNSSSGRYFSRQSVGHLGFTGTSFWIDLQEGIVVVLLTNRVHPSRTNEKIKAFRPYFHDALMEELRKV